MFFKKMITVLLAITCMMGVSSEAQASERKILGLWKSTQDSADTKGDKKKCSSEKYYYFAKDGVFVLPEQNARMGISWDLSQDKVLSLMTSTVPAESVSKEFFKVVVLKRNKMVLQNTVGKEITFEKIKDTVVRINGNLNYRERMALPPFVETRVTLYADGEPFLINSLQSPGQIPLPFSLYFIAKEKDTKITLDAAIYYEYNKLFGTIEPIVVEPEYINNKAKNNDLNVLLYRSQSFEAAPQFIVSPSAYTSKDGQFTLYLEDAGFGIFKDKENIETIRWNQVDRNHNIEILRSGKEPLFVTVQSQNKLVFKQLNDKDSVVFSSIDKKFSQEVVNLTGMYTEMGSKGYFTDCNSKKQFVIDFANNAELHEAFLGLDSNVGLVTMEALISRENDNIMVNVRKLKSLDKSKKCAPIFQNAGLANTYWRLVTLNDKVAEAYEHQPEPHLIIRDDQATGSDGCNGFFIPVSTTDDKLTFGIGGSTLMLCPQGNAQATEFLQTLNKVTNWSISGSVLQLETDNEVKLTFEAVYL